ncbi:MAG TPA: NAD-dependent epimerase/dehydratase family protein [Acidobacteriaceae bacterium]
MAVLVTGASGFLGGRLVELLAARGERVILVARQSSRLTHLDHLTSDPSGQVVAVRVEIGSWAEAVPESLRAVLPEVTHIYHCAGCSTDWAPPETYYAGNVVATQSLLGVATQAPRLERFVHVSTTDIYGYPVIPGDETQPAVDVGLGYNHTKILGEQAAWAAAAAGLPVTIVRPASIYGPRGTAFVTDIAKLLRERTMALVDGGRVPGGFVYVDDVAEAMMAAAESPATLGRAYNLSSLQGETWKQYCVGLALAMSVPAPWINLPFAVAMAVGTAMEAPHRYLRVPGRPLLTRHAVYLLGRDQEFPSSRAQAEFGYGPRVSLEQGIDRSAAWLRDQARG